jgi:hypothetical protein
VIQAIPPTPPTPPMPPFDPNLMWLNDNGPAAIVMIVALSLLAATVILWPIMRALGRRLESRSGGQDSALRAEVDNLQRRMGEVDTLQMRVNELEERLDFAERLLTRGQESRS